MRQARGLSLLEIIVVVAVLGVLTAIALMAMPRDGLAVNQAASALSRNVQLARFEAIRQNTFVGLRIPAESDTYEFFAGRAYDSSSVFRAVRLGTDDTPGVRIGPVAPTDDVVFDPRGMLVSLPAEGKEVTLMARGASRVVTITRSGRTETR